jgi:hypothetical protein
VDVLCNELVARDTCMDYNPVANLKSLPPHAILSSQSLMALVLHSYVGTVRVSQREC